MKLEVVPVPAARSQVGRPVSVVRDPRLTYPDAADYFSPDQSFPEYRWGHLSKNPNGVYAAVRQCLAQAGLDADNYGSPRWNPLGEYVSPGQKVFVLCNFVQHNIRKDIESEYAKCTHGSVVRAVIDYVLLALDGRGSVQFGNAPLQSCDWTKVIHETGAERVEEFYKEFSEGGAPVILSDLRQVVMRRNSWGTVESCCLGSDEAYVVPVDLGKDSLLDAFYGRGTEPKLRVLDYDYHRTESCHNQGKHLYSLSKPVLESDVLISLPKLKTHEKVGITCGLKGCVGAVAQKDCLAHHRFGSPRAGGDEYPDTLGYLTALSIFHDWVYGSKPGILKQASHSLNFFSRKILRRFTRALSGSWPGNDTCWRMALDLARILAYADKEGRLRSEKQRPHIMLTDGIIGGEGDGPLSPEPFSFGYLSFSEDITLGDYINCLAMGFEPHRIPLIREALCLKTYRLAHEGSLEGTILINGRAGDINGLRSRMGRKFLAPREWRRWL